jgi:hypothetical protein
MKNRSLYFIIAALLLLIPLAGLAYLGTFTRLHADDFCMAGNATRIGLAGLLALWYTTWTGRFSYILGTGLFGLGGPGLAGWLPATASAAWLAGLSWAFLPLVRRAGWPRPRLLAMLAASLTLLVVFSTTPNLFQSFFWQDGMVNYSLPLIGLTFSAGIILRAWLDKPPILPAALGAFGLAFVSGGFTEVASAMQIALIVLALAAALLLGNRAGRGRLVLVLAAALVGGLAAMAIVLAAPGNQVRQATTSAAPGLVRIITFSIRNAAFIAAKYIIWTPGWALLSAAVPFLAGWMASSAGPTSRARVSLRLMWQKNWFRGVVLGLLAAFGLVVAACAPVVFALNAYPDDRAIIVPQFVLALGVITTSALLGHGLRDLGVLPSPLEKPNTGRALQVAILAALLVAAGSSLWKTASQAPDFQAYARAWDERAAILQQASLSGQTEVTVVGLHNRFGVADLGIPADYWVNSCVAFYYNLDAVHGR